MYYFTVINDKENLSFANSMKVAKDEYNPRYNFGIELKEKDYLNKLLNTASYGFLPAGVRFISPVTNLVVLEIPPSYRTIAISDHGKYGVRRSNTSTIVAPFPWVVFVVEMDEYHVPYSSKMYFRNKPLSEKDIDVFVPLMMNVSYGSQEICMPEGFRSKYSTLGDGLNAFLDKFWNSSFNHDIAIDPGTLSKFYEDNNITRDEKAVSYHVSLTMEYFSFIQTLSIEDMVSFKYQSTVLPPGVLKLTNIDTASAVKGKLQQAVYN